MLAPAALNRTWAVDFMSGTLYDDRRFRTLNVLDEGNGEALAVEIATSLPGARVVVVLEQLVAIHGAPRAVRWDNGPELVSEALRDWAERRGVALHFIQPGKPNQHASLERFDRTYRRGRSSTRASSPRSPTCAPRPRRGSPPTTPSGRTTA